MPQDRSLIQLPPTTRGRNPYASQTVNDPIRDFLLGIIGVTDADPKATVATNAGALLNLSPLGRLGRLGKTLFSRMSRATPLPSRVIPRFEPPLTQGMSLDSRITGLPPTPQPKLPSTAQLEEDRIYQIMKDRLEQKRLEDIKNPPEPKPKPVDRRDVNNAPRTHKPITQVEDDAPNVSFPNRFEGEEGEYLTRFDSESHNPLVNLAPRGGMSTYDPAIAREKARLMLELAETPVEDASLRAMFRKAPRAMGNVEMIRLGDDAKNAIGKVDYSHAPTDAIGGNQTDLRTDTFIDTGEWLPSTPETNKRSVINLANLRPTTAVHELAHGGQQLRYGKDFSRLYKEAGGHDNMTNYRGNKFEIGATEAANNAVFGKDITSRLRKRFEKSFPYVNNPNAPAEERLLDNSVIDNMLRDYFNNPAKRSELINMADRGARDAWRSMFTRPDGF